MKRSRQLVLESAVIAGVLIMITLGGSISTTAIPPSFQLLSNPSQVTRQYDLSGLARYYNLTLGQLGIGQFGNASFLLRTFPFVSIPPRVNQTALAANADLAEVNVSLPKAISYLDQAQSEIGAKQYLNASTLVGEGCAQVRSANLSFSDFLGVQTSRLRSFSVPVQLYAAGSAITAVEIGKLQARCNSLASTLPAPNADLTISSPQRAIETGGSVKLDGTLTLNGTGLGGQEVLFYINGSYFGSIASDASGGLADVLRIPFLYAPSAYVQAVVGHNSTVGLGGASSNVLNFAILFNATNIVLGDPPSYLPTQSFSVHGNLTTASGVPLPEAPVRVTFLDESERATTDSSGRFSASFSVPADAKDGVYYVDATFAPQGIFGPSFNFTSIQVVHLPLTLAVETPRISFAGFTSSVGGTATSNGTAVSGANITVLTPWGTESTLTDRGGNFELQLPVSPLEFAFSRSVTVTGVAAEPYFAGTRVVTSLGLFNILLIVLPVAGAVVAVYEAQSLGMIRREDEGEEGEEAARRVGTMSEPVEISTEGVAEPVAIYRGALSLAQAALGLGFRKSQTVREIARVVEASGVKGLEGFSRIYYSVEDYLYSASFDNERLAELRSEMRKLEAEWG